MTEKSWKYMIQKRRGNTEPEEKRNGSITKRGERSLSVKYLEKL